MTRLESLSILQKYLLKPQHTVLIGARQLVQYLQDTKALVYYLTLEDPTILNAIN